MLSIIKNIPSKARVVLVTTGVLAVSFIFVFLNFFGSEAEKGADNFGGVKLPPPPTVKAIDKPKPGDESIIPSDSPVKVEIEREKEQRIEEAKKTGGGFMSQIEFENKTELVKEGKVEDNFNSISLSELHDENEKEAAKLIEKERERLRESSTPKPERKKVAIVSYMTKEEQDEFLASELSSLSSKNMKYKLKREQDINTSSSDYNNYEQGAGNQNKKTKVARESSDYSGVNIISERFKRNLNSVDEGTINKYRGIGNRNKAQDEGYKSLANPISYTSEEKALHIDSGEMHYAILQIGINTDELGPTTAYIPGDGKFGGATLVGYPVRLGEKAMINFKEMNLNGKNHTVNVVALDPETLRPGLADNVDNHVFERYFKLALSAAVDGYATALTGTKTKTFPNGGSEDITERLPKAKDQLAVAIGNIGKKLTPKFEKAFERPPTVEVSNNRDVILMFLSGSK